MKKLSSPLLLHTKEFWDLNPYCSINIRENIDKSEVANSGNYREEKEVDMWSELREFPQIKYNFLSCTSPIFKDPCIGRNLEYKETNFTTRILHLRI